MIKLFTYITFICFSLNLNAQQIEVEFSVEETLQNTEVSFEFDDVFIEQEQLGFPLRGKLSFDLGYQIDSPKRWITAGPYAQLIADKQTHYGQFYGELTIRNNYAFKIEGDSQAVQNRYQLDPVVRELYWKKAFGDKTLTVGKSIVTWGKADLSTIIDIISPVDNSASLFAKPEEIKVGQNVIKLDWYSGNKEMNFIVVPQALNNSQIEAGHPYNVVPQSPNNVSDNNAEWAIRLNQVFDKWEYSAVVGDVHQRDPLIINHEQTYLKNPVAGLGLVYSADPFLWKLEGLFIKDKPMQLLSFNGVKNNNSYKIMAGFDYSHKTFGNWIVEMSGESPVTDDNAVLAGEGSKVTAVTWSDQFLKDDLSANVVLLVLGNNIDNHLIRAGLTYKLDDEWTVTTQLSIINSTGSDVFLNAISKFDRLDVSLNYNFDLSN